MRQTLPAPPGRIRRRLMTTLAVLCLAAACGLSPTSGQARAAGDKPVRLTLPYELTALDTYFTPSVPGSRGSSCDDGWQMFATSVRFAFKSCSHAAKERLQRAAHGYLFDYGQRSCSESREVEIYRVESGFYASGWVYRGLLELQQAEQSGTTNYYIFDPGTYEARAKREVLKTKLRKAGEVRREGKRAPRYPVTVVCPATSTTLGSPVWECYADGSSWLQQQPCDGDQKSAIRVTAGNPGQNTSR